MADKRLNNGEMLKLVLDEIRPLRKRVDDHIGDVNKNFVKIQKDISSINIKLENHGTRIGGFSAGIVLVVAGGVSWIMGAFRS